VGRGVTTVLLDTHVVHWWAAEPERLSPAATEAIVSADVLAVAAISWFELAWLAERGRIVITIPLRAWLDRMAVHLRTVPIGPAVAAAAVALPGSFGGDPADRLIYATAVENGWRLVTKDLRLRNHPSPRSVAVW
jgi:PIN domain nuclease of toxin-antitoxin system